jgi:hypothetical protein
LLFSYLFDEFFDIKFFTAPMNQWFYKVHCWDPGIPVCIFPHKSNFLNRIHGISSPRIYLPAGEGTFYFILPFIAWALVVPFVSAFQADQSHVDSCLGAVPQVAIYKPFRLFSG